MYNNLQAKVNRSLIGWESFKCYNLAWDPWNNSYNLSDMLINGFLVNRQSLIVSGGICYVNRALSNRNLQTLLGQKQPMES